MILIDNRTEYSTTLPVSLSEIKSQVGLSQNFYDLDSDLEALVWSAVNYIERAYGIAVVAQTWVQKERCPPYHKLRLEHFPFVSLDSVSYTDPAGNEQPYDVSNFILMASDTYPAYIQVKDQVSVPQTVRSPIAWSFEYQAGYETLPPNLKHAIKVLCASMYVNKESEVVGSIVAKLDLGFDRLIGPFHVEM